MATAQLERLVRGISRRVREPDSDEVLLSRFCQEHDGSSFSELVQRHGPTVLGVCRRVLGDHHAAEDAFQATFLVLARRAGDVSPPGAVGAWLYGVAYRTALKARGRVFRRKAVEQEYVVRWLENTAIGGSSEAVDPDLLAAIDTHLNALPARYRVPLVLCGVQGLGKAEAAEKLGVPEGTVSSRLARGRAMLRDRLVRHGYAIPAAALATTLLPGSLQAEVPTDLAFTTASAGPGFAAGCSAEVSTEALALSHEVLRSMTLIKWQLLSVLTVLGLTFGGFAGTFSHADQKKPMKPGADVTTKKPSEGEKPRKPGAGEKPKPEGEKPKKPGGEKVDGHRLTGRVERVNAAAGTITLATKNEKGAGEQVIQLAEDARVGVEGKPGKLADVPAGTMAMVFIPNDSKQATAVMFQGPRMTGFVAKVEGDTVSIGPKGVDSKETRVFTVGSDTQLLVDGKPGNVKDVKPDMHIGVQLSLDSKSVLVMKVVRGDAEKPTKPGAKPEGDKPGKASAKADGEKPMKPGTKPVGEKPTKPGVKSDGEKPMKPGSKPDSDKALKPGTKKPDGEKPTKPGTDKAIKPGTKKPEGDKPVKPGAKPDSMK